MGRRKRVIKLICGIVLGFFVSQFCSNYSLSRQELCGFRLQNHRHDPKVGTLPNTTEKNLLFVGVMTAAKYLDSRAKAVYDTWGKEVPGRIAFFSSEFSYSESVPLVALPKIDDSYPPQRKSFTMLKYMHDNYINKFEWFLRADDDVYIRMDKLEALLRSVDSAKPWFIGQTGKGNNEEFGLLSLDSDENFCMGGPGVIFSKETLKRIAPFIDECLQNLYTSHEDVELGRCVRKFAGVSCTWSYEMQVILYHNQSGSAAFTGDLKQKEVHRAITLHPVKQPLHMYRLHNYLKGLKIQDNLQESLNLHRDIATSMKHLGVSTEKLSRAELVEGIPLFPEPLGSSGYLGDPQLLGVPTGLNRFHTTNLTDLLEWELIAKSLYSSKDLNPKRRVGSSMKEGLNDVTREVMELINSYSKQRGRVIDFKEILYGYWRLDPVNGVDLILDLLLIYRKYRGHKMTVHVRRHAYIQQTFTGINIREVDVRDAQSVQQRGEGTQITGKLLNDIFLKIGDSLPEFFGDRNKSVKYINFILPLSGRFKTFKRFLGTYENYCIKGGEETNLIIVLYGDDKNPEDFHKTIELVSEKRAKYKQHEIKIIVINETFSRGRALQYGVNATRSDDLLLFIDVDIIFDNRSLLRIRHNTIKNKQVYFPIVYSMYNPKLLNKTYTFEDYVSNNVIIDEDNGFWRQFGFGIASLYRSDYLNLGGFNTSITGWGVEDVTFYDNVIKSNLSIVRTVDPSLIHVYHNVDCEGDLEVAQKNMCIGTQASTFGSLHELQKYFKRFRYLFR